MSIKINNDTANGSSILQPSNTATGDVTHTLPSFTTELAPRMQLMTAQNSTSGTSIDFTGIPSWAKKITVMFSGVSGSGTSPFLVRLGTSGGFVSTGYSSCAMLGTTSLVNTTGFITNIANVAVNLTYGSIFLNNLTSNTWVESGVTTQAVASTTANSGGGVTLSSTLDSIRITTVNGTDLFDAGQINILVEG